MSARASIALLFGLVTLWTGHRLGLAVYASFGPFSAVFGGPVRTANRYKIQTLLAVLLMGAVVTGAVAGLSEQRRWIAIPLVAVWASVATGLSDRMTWRPPGSMFLVFAVAASSSVPAHPSDVGWAALMSGATGALAVGLGLLEVRVMGPMDLSSAPPLPPVTPEVDRPRQVLAILRSALAVAVAGVVATASGVGHPYWAMVAAVVPLAGANYQDQMRRGFHRVVGTLVGIGVASLLLWPHLSDAGIIVLVVILQAGTELVVVRNYAVAVTLITPLGLLVVRLAVPEASSQLVMDRLIETIIGVATGWGTLYLTRRLTANDGVA